MIRPGWSLIGLRALAQNNSLRGNRERNHNRQGSPFLLSQCDDRSFYIDDYTAITCRGSGRRQDLGDETISRTILWQSWHFHNRSGRRVLSIAPEARFFSGWQCKGSGYTSRCAVGLESSACASSQSRERHLRSLRDPEPARAMAFLVPGCFDQCAEESPASVSGDHR